MPSTLSLVSACCDVFFYVSQSQRFDYDPENDGRSACGYVGLKNLGNICYMNSIMQQLYMLPEVRNGLLSAPLNEEDPDDDVLYQTQRMLAALYLSERQATTLQVRKTVGACYLFASRQACHRASAKLTKILPETRWMCKSSKMQLSICLECWTS